MRVAFYAPLKAPDHPVPSGDRRVAQLFVEALRQAGHEPVVASRLRSFEGRGDPARQAHLRRRGTCITAALTERWRQNPSEAPGLWFTYHLYYKAPDWIGPAVSAALGVPYVVAEASHAPKQAAGGWGDGHQAVAAALRRADLVIGLNPSDRACVLPLLRTPDCWMSLPPFLDAAAYRVATHHANRPVRLVTIAMMRPGDKLASYRVLGAALATLGDLPWTLEVIGDGPARADVVAALSQCADRMTYTGALEPAEIAARLAAADLFIWPAINEAFGMALLEAQASGLPVVAGDSGGVSGIVADDATGLLTRPGDATQFAAAVRRLITDPDTRRAMGVAARRKVLAEHDLTPAACRLGAALGQLQPAPAASFRTVA